MGCMLAQEGDNGVDKEIYYISKRMMECEEQYTPLEKKHVGLATKKLRHYMLVISEPDFSYGST